MGLVVAFCSICHEPILVRDQIVQGKVKHYCVKHPPKESDEST